MIKHRQESIQKVSGIKYIFSTLGSQEDYKKKTQGGSRHVSVVKVRDLKMDNLSLSPQFGLLNGFDLSDPWGKFIVLCKYPVSLPSFGWHC